METIVRGAKISSILATKDRSYHPMRQWPSLGTMVDIELCVVCMWFLLTLVYSSAQSRQV